MNWPSIARHSTPAAKATGSFAEPSWNSGPEMLAWATCERRDGGVLREDRDGRRCMPRSTCSAPNTLQVPSPPARVKARREILPCWIFEFRVRAIEIIDVVVERVGEIAAEAGQGPEGVALVRVRRRDRRSSRITALEPNEVDVAGAAKPAERRAMPRSLPRRHWPPARRRRAAGCACSRLARRSSRQRLVDESKSTLPVTGVAASSLSTRLLMKRHLGIAVDAVGDLIFAIAAEQPALLRDHQVVGRRIIVAVGRLLTGARLTPGVREDTAPTCRHEIGARAADRASTARIGVRIAVEASADALGRRRRPALRIVGRADRDQAARPCRRARKRRSRGRRHDRRRG